VPLQQITLACGGLSSFTCPLRVSLLQFVSLCGEAQPASSFLLIVGAFPSATLNDWSSDLAGASYSGQATTFAWANEICADDYQERGIVLASMNMWNNVINAWWPLLFYRATDAPQFKTGMITMICVCIATLAVTYAVWYLEKREIRKTVDHGRDALAVTDEKEDKVGYQN